MLGRRQVTPGWENDTVWGQDSQQGRDKRGRISYPPPGVHLVSGVNGGAGLKSIAT